MERAVGVAVPTRGQVDPSGDGVVPPRSWVVRVKEQNGALDVFEFDVLDVTEGCTAYLIERQRRPTDDPDRERRSCKEDGDGVFLTGGQGT